MTGSLAACDASAARPRSTTSGSSPCSRSCSRPRQAWPAAARPGVANAVLGQVRHALCIVTGGWCGAERRVPCVVASKRDTLHVAVTIVLVRLDGDRYVLREKLSDGTVRLTLVHRGGAGIELGVGARARVTLEGARDRRRRASCAAGAEGISATARSIVARDDREADEILRALRRRVPLDRRRRPGPERAPRRGRHARPGPARPRRLGRGRVARCAGGDDPRRAARRAQPATSRSH